MSIIHRLLPAITTLAAAVWLSLAAAGQAGAVPIGPDPHTPLPGLGWCPGGGTFTPFGGYCDGLKFPDGSFWHQVRIFGFWHMSCNVDDGSNMPPLAGPTGCGLGVPAAADPDLGLGGLGTVA